MIELNIYISGIFALQKEKMSIYRYCISLGSNLGNKTLNIQNALNFLSTKPLQLIQSSGLYASAAWGYQSTNDFINACAIVESALEPIQFLAHIKAYEKGAGRVKNVNERYTDRIIDLDILLCDDLILKTETLEIPHPQLHTRNFVLVPLNEIGPTINHPVLNLPIATLVQQSNDSGEVIKLINN